MRKKKDKELIRNKVRKPGRLDVRTLQSVKNLKKEIIHYVLPLGNGWVVKNAASKSFIAITDSKKEAILIGRNLAKTKHSELVVHNKDGGIAIQESYAL